MKSIRIILENIGVFRDRREYILSTGLNIIYAPNASGKTSLINGLKVLMLPSLTTEEIAKALNDYEEKGRVKLVIDDSEFSVDLIRMPDGTVRAQGRRFTEDSLIERVAFIDLGSDLVAAILAGNHDLVKSILREVTGVSHVETILDTLTRLKSEYEYSFQARRKEYESKREVYVEQRQRLTERLENIRKRIVEILQAPQLEPARKKMEELESKRNTLLEIQRRLREQKLEITNRIGLLKRDHDLNKSELDIHKREREKIVKELDELRRAGPDMRRALEILLKEVENLQTERENIISEIREKERMLERRKEVIDYAVCPYCGAPIEEDRIRSEIYELEEDLEKLRSELKKIINAIEEKRMEINEIREKAERRLKELEEELKKIDERIVNIERVLDTVDGKIKQENKRLAKIEDEIKDLDKELNVVNVQLEVLRSEVPINLIEEYRYLTNEEQKLYEELDSINAKLRQLDELYNELRVLEDKLERVRLLQEYFQIRLNELTRATVERINEVILKHMKLLKLAELEYPVLVEDFTLTLTRAGGTPTTLAELSDAEKAIFTILMTLVLKEYVAEEFPFYVVDTLMEFIDDTRAAEVLKYLMEAAGNDKVIIVTKTRPFTGEPRLLSQEDILVNTIPSALTQPSR